MPQKYKDSENYSGNCKEHILELTEKIANFIKSQPPPPFETLREDLVRALGESSFKKIEDGIKNIVDEKPGLTKFLKAIRCDVKLSNKEMILGLKKTVDAIVNDDETLVTSKKVLNSIIDKLVGLRKVKLKCMLPTNNGDRKAIVGNFGVLYDEDEKGQDIEIIFKEFCEDENIVFNDCQCENGCSIMQQEHKGSGKYKEYTLESTEKIAKFIKSQPPPPVDD